jgi:hypothetical protein
MRRSSALLLRRWTPLLLAVMALLGPGPAWAGDPAPDPAAAGAPAPDAAPLAHPTAPPAKPLPRVTAPTAVAHVAPTQIAPTVRAPAVAAPVTVAPQVAPVVRKPTRPTRVVHHSRKHVVRSETPILDVPPFRVDVHRGLGAVTRTLHDESTLLLAGIALLVATSTAASGAALALVAARSARRRT